MPVLEIFEKDTDYGKGDKRVDLRKAYISGAESREKRIAELEMTVGTLRTFSNEQATCIERLERENTELKDYNKYLRRKRQGGIQKQYNKVAIIKQQKEQLTKAKELLNEFMRITEMVEGFEPDYSELIARAEAFLEEVK